MAIYEFGWGFGCVGDGDILRPPNDVTGLNIHDLCAEQMARRPSAWTFKNRRERTLFSMPSS